MSRIASRVGGGRRSYVFGKWNFQKLGCAACGAAGGSKGERLGQAKPGGFLRGNALSAPKGAGRRYPPKELPPEKPNHDLSFRGWVFFFFCFVQKKNLHELVPPKVPQKIFARRAGKKKIFFSAGLKKYFLPGDQKKSKNQLIFGIFLAKKSPPDKKTPGF